MITAVNAQALASSVSAGPAERPDAEQAFKALDSGNKGYLTVDDLQAAVVKISAEGAKRAEAPAPAAPSAQQMLAKLDGNADGKVTQQEFKAAQPKAPPPTGGQAPAGGADRSAGGGAAATGSSTKAYEPADTNEDGKVSAQEQQAYDAKLAAEKVAQEAQKAGSGRSSEADAAVKAYESVEQLGAAG